MLAKENGHNEDNMQSLLPLFDRYRVPLRKDPTVEKNLTYEVGIPRYRPTTGEAATSVIGGPSSR